MGPRAAAKKRREFDPHAFLATIGEGRKSVLFQRKQESLRKGMPLMQCFISRPVR